MSIDDFIEIPSPNKETRYYEQISKRNYLNNKLVSRNVRVYKYQNNRWVRQKDERYYKQTLYEYTFYMRYLGDNPRHLEGRVRLWDWNINYDKAKDKMTKSLQVEFTKDQSYYQEGFMVNTRGWDITIKEDKNKMGHRIIKDSGWIKKDSLKSDKASYFILDPRGGKQKRGLTWTGVLNER